MHSPGHRHRKLGLSGDDVTDLSAKVSSTLSNLPGEVEACVARGNEAGRAGRLEEAGRFYSRALELKPDHPSANVNLAVVLLRLGKVEEAVDKYRVGLALRPDHPRAHNDLGWALFQLGRLDEAVASYRRAVELKSDYADAHNNLGTALLRLKRFDEAVASLKRALDLQPDGYVHHNLGEALRGVGDLEGAAEHLTVGSGNNSKAKALECLYEIGHRTKYESLLQKISDTDPDNIRIAAIAAYVESQWNSTNNYNFCRNPINFIWTRNIISEVEEFSSFFNVLADDLLALNANWEPANKTTKNGFQTAGNLFDLKLPSLDWVRKIVHRLILEYRATFSSEPCDLIAHWPEQFIVNSWCTRLLKGGHQDAHIHPGGWVSGVLYIQLPKAIADDQGAIEFSLHGYDYPILNANISKVVFRPQVGDIVIFPSSLFHKTIPFFSDEDRICIAFDMVPVRISPGHQEHPVGVVCTD